MKTFKVKTGLKAGESRYCEEQRKSLEDLYKDYDESCLQGKGPQDPRWAQAGRAIGGSWAQRGMDIGRQFAGGWF